MVDISDDALDAEGSFFFLSLLQAEIAESSLFTALGLDAKNIVRGKRARKPVKYNVDEDDDEDEDNSSD